MLVYHGQSAVGQTYIDLADALERVEGALAAPRQVWLWARLDNVGEMAQEGCSDTAIARAVQLDDMPQVALLRMTARDMGWNIPMEEAR